MDIFAASIYLTMALSAVFALVAVAMVNGRRANFMGALSAVFMAVFFAILGAQFVSAFLLVCMVSVFFVSTMTTKEKINEPFLSRTPAFVAALATIVSSFFIVILLLIIFRRPFVAVPLSGSLFESSDVVGLAMLSRYPVAAVLLSVGVFVVALVSAFVLRMRSIEEVARENGAGPEVSQ